MHDKRKCTVRKLLGPQTVAAAAAAAAAQQARRVARKKFAVSYPQKLFDADL